MNDIIQPTRNLRGPFRNAIPKSRTAEEASARNVAGRVTERRPSIPGDRCQSVPERVTSRAALDDGAAFRGVALLVTLFRPFTRPRSSGTGHAELSFLIVTISVEPRGNGR
jgi:hypothetical protein